MVDQKMFRWSAALMFIGIAINFVLNFVHPGGPGTDQTVFTLYANSSSWTAIHLGQFVGTAFFTAGLLVLFLVLNLTDRISRVVGILGAVSAAVALALEGVVYAVDGVALKQVVDAWVSAPAAEKTARFASAEAIRWLETGTRSYQNFMSGLALVLFAAAIVLTARIPRPIGYFLGLIGLAIIVQGWLQGTQGLQAAAVVFIGGINGLAITVWVIWLLIVAMRRKAAIQPASV
jgi:hypothetical protein